MGTNMEKVMVNRATARVNSIDAVRSLVAVLLVSVLTLLVACGSNGSGSEKEIDRRNTSGINPSRTMTAEEKLVMSTPFPTAITSVEGCEIGPGAQCPGADFTGADLGAQPVGYGGLDEAGVLSFDFTEVAGLTQHYRTAFQGVGEDLIVAWQLQ